MRRYLGERLHWLDYHVRVALPTAIMGQISLMRILFLFLLGLPASLLAAIPLSYQTLEISSPLETQGLSIVDVKLNSNQFDRAGVKSYRVVVPYAKDGAVTQLMFTAVHEKKSGKSPKSARSKPEQLRLMGLLQQSGQSGRIGIVFYARQSLNAQDAHPLAELKLDLGKASKAPAAVLQDWARMRALKLFRQLRENPDSSFLHSLFTATQSAYGAGDFKRLFDLGRTDSRRQANLLSLLSADAAIEETLQTQLLTGTGSHTEEGDFGKLKGVQVPGLPFKKLLAGRRGGKLPIATLVPPDRYFVLLNQPGKVIGDLEKLSETGLDLVNTSRSQRLTHQLLDKYLARLHLNRTLVGKLAESGSVRQLAFFGPDLYLDHGSDVTVILDASKIQKVKSVISAFMGAKDKFGISRFAVPLSGVPKAYYAAYGRWMLFSTDLNEIKAALRLARSKGKGSLGKSAEFRYMLTLLKRKAEKRQIYVYFSDPFIRRMVSPQVKIAQLRRAVARTQLKRLTAAAQLYHMDYGKWPDLPELKKRKFVSEDLLRTNHGDRLKVSRGGAHSELYGTLAWMTPLNRIAVTDISRFEQSAYENYLQNYNRYWRTFFDPIGILVTLDKNIEVETFILPLVNNTIYRGARELLSGRPVTMEVPGLSPAPLTIISMRLNKAAKTNISKLLRETRILGPASRHMAFDDVLGDSVHMALYDNNPVVSVGSQKMLGAFTSDWLDMGRMDDFLFIGMLANMMTQPVSLFVKIQNRPQLEKMMGLLSRRPFRARRSGVNYTVHRLGRDLDRGWVISVNLFNLIDINLFVRIVDDYLVVSNREFDFKKDASAAGSLGKSMQSHASIRFDFTRLQKMQAPLFFNQMKSHAKTFVRGEAVLIPMFLAGAKDVNEAVNRHQQLYGSQPVIPLNDKWTWHGETAQMQSELFGFSSQPRIPSYFDMGDKFVTSVFDRLRQMNLAFRLEKEGVRVLIRANPAVD